jgi:type VII secretion effector (TIGR04197 family)
MTSIKLDKSQWDGVVSKAASELNNVGPTISVTLSKTTLAPFTDLPKVLAELSKAFISYKTAAQTDLTKMQQVAENIVSEDKSAGNQIKNAVRFK